MFLLLPADTYVLSILRCHCCHFEQSWMPTAKEITGSEPGQCIAIFVVSVLVLKWRRKPQSCNLGTPKLQPRSLTWPGPEVVQLPPKTESTNPEQSPIHFLLFRQQSGHKHKVSVKYHFSSESISLYRGNYDE